MNQLLWWNELAAIGRGWVFLQLASFSTTRVCGNGAFGCGCYWLGCAEWGAKQADNLTQSEHSFRNPKRGLLSPHSAPGSSDPAANRATKGQLPNQTHAPPHQTPRFPGWCQTGWRGRCRARSPAVESTKRKQSGFRAWGWGARLGGGAGWGCGRRRGRHTKSPGRVNSPARTAAGGHSGLLRPPPC